MAYRCEGCNKFASVDPEVQTSEADYDSVETDTEGRSTVTFNVNATIALTSQCCGYEVATGEDSNDGAVVIEHTSTCASREDADFEDYTVEVGSEDTDEEWDGKPGTPARYRRHYYVAVVDVDVTCGDCGESDNFECRVKIQAGNFEASW